MDRRVQTFYVLGEVGTARYAVRAAFNGALTGLERLTVQRVPPAGRGRGRRSAASLPNGIQTRNTYLPFESLFDFMKRFFLSCSLLLLTRSLLFGAEPLVPAVALAFSPDGDTLLVGGHREVRTYSVARGERKSTFVCEFPKISALAFSPDAGTLAVSGGTPGVGGGVILLEWPKGKGVGHLTNHTDQATAVAFNPAGTMLATSAWLYEWGSG